MSAFGRALVNLCVNKGLSLANPPDLITSAKTVTDSHGFGMASARVICGTQDRNQRLEQKLAKFLGLADSILFAACFDAKGGLDLCTVIPHSLGAADVEAEFATMRSGRSGKVVLDGTRGRQGGFPLPLWSGSLSLCQRRP